MTDTSRMGGGQAKGASRAAVTLALVAICGLGIAVTSQIVAPDLRAAPPAVVAPGAAAPAPAVAPAPLPLPPAPAWAEILVVDAATGRGVPLVELETVNGIRFVTDNAGRVAFGEPGLLGREVHFSVRSHGYAAPKDGFGIAGARVTPAPGKVATIRLRRTMVSERLCRLTGEGLFRDSVLLGHKVAHPDPLGAARVAGQDSIQTVLHRGRVLCFWGDTSRMEYPLGLFRMAGATLPVPDPKDPASDPAVVGGLGYRYWTDPKTGFARAMMPLAERPDGVVWVFSLAVVPDAGGRDVVVGHYSRRKGLEVELEQGLCTWDDEREIFVPASRLPADETWRRPNGHPIVREFDGRKWLLYGSPNPNVRVPASLADLLDPAKYEAFTAARTGKPGEPDAPDGKPNWRWQKELPPTDSKTEAAWVKAGKIRPESARFCPVDAAAGDPAKAERVTLHSGSVRWNAHRKKWVLVACQIGGRSSFLGEVWYAESDDPTGPFARAVRVATHERQTFYNACHQDWLDRDGGRTIHFEGTYTNDFSGNPNRTARYNYNQVMHRLDLDVAELRVLRQ